MLKITDTYNRFKQLSRPWRVTISILVIILFLYIGLVVYRIPAAQEKLATEDAVNRIHSQKLTLADVMGDNLPPEPDPALKDGTIEGVDANSNGIRDDVELALFKLHPESARLRAAQLQYAMALQIELTDDIFNPETFIAAIQEGDRASSCISNLYPRDDLKEFLKVSNERQEEVEQLVFNTDSRKERREEVLNFLTSYGPIDRSYCDIDTIALPN